MKMYFSRTAGGCAEIIRRTSSRQTVRYIRGCGEINISGGQTIMHLWGCFAEKEVATRDIIGLH